MKYETFEPGNVLRSLVKCYWTLEVPAEKNADKQRIVPDGCLEMAFILGDDIRRFTSRSEFILQPRAMVLGQTIEPFYIQPTGYVNTFAVRFYPYGFANFVSTSIKDLANKETPIIELFEATEASELNQEINHARDTQQRIKIVEAFLLTKLNEKTTIDNIVKSTIDILFSSNGNSSISTVLKENLSKRRQLERNFIKQIGVSPKQLGKVIRMQAALKMLLNHKARTLTQIAYENEYYDQAHFIKDFKEFTGTNPKDFLGDSQNLLSSLFYQKD